MGTYLRPASVHDALQMLAAGRPALLAGGTDFYPARAGRPITEDVLDITALADLRGIREEGGGYRIGALATWTDVLRAPLPEWFRGLKLAAREIGGMQIQNTGTLVGNLCNASPAADGVPALLALDASVELARVDRRRTLPLAAFVLGNRVTARTPDELVTAILIPGWRAGARSGFLKLGARKYLVISIAMAAGTLAVDSDHRIERCALAVGACSAVAQRLVSLESALLGHPLRPGIGNEVRAEHLACLTPIDDVRGTAEYRREAALTLVRRLLEGLADE